ncbi:TolC family protein [Pirellulimonas nuda]|nr:TolC family protein [Pirellulimonas nuda]
MRLLLAAAMLASGCRVNRPDCSFYDGSNCEVGCVGPQQLELEEPCTDCEIESVSYETPASLNPLVPIEYRDITLEEAIQHALANSKVMRDLGGTLINRPALQPTVYDPAIVFSDPRTGEEAALSEFDASFAARSFWENNDREFNNTFVGDRGYLKQDLGNYGFELRKRSVTGTQMVARHTIDYDFNNNIGNRFNGAGTASGEYQAIVDGEIRQPLLQGAGVLFNRIAGPSTQPGVLNGVMLARVRTDIGLADFEVAVRDLVANVENAYWDLYFTYRDLDAKKRARDYALETYQSVAAEAAGGREGGEADKLGQALEQYWRYESEVINALNGRTLEGTRTDNGSGGGTSRSPVGVQLAERRLRLIIGMPVNGGPILRPADEPVVVPVSFDWPTLVTEATASRPELRRQRWRVKQVELELIANRNFLLPQLDAVGRYRYRGFGEDLISQSGQQFSSAYQNLADGGYQEWQLGVELEIPLGFRRGHTAVRTSELALARERVILAEQKRDVVFGLSNAAADVQRAFQVAEAQYNRFDAAQRQIQALKAAQDAGRVTVDLVLEAQRRVLDAEILYHQARVDFMLALRNVHFENGTLLAYNNIYLNEGASQGQAYCDAIDLEERRLRPLDYVCRDAVISRGQVDQSAGVPGGHAPMPAVVPAPPATEPAAPKALPGFDPASEPLPTPAGDLSLLLAPGA